MPIHPLKGLKLKLVGMRRDHLAGCQTVIAEVADGSHIVPSERSPASRSAQVLYRGMQTLLNYEAGFEAGLKASGRACRFGR